MQESIRLNVFTTIKYLCNCVYLQILYNLNIQSEPCKFCFEGWVHHAIEEGIITGGGHGDHMCDKF